jgi:pimeloyl-ACP methyl ester carboxylesterase
MRFFGWIALLVTFVPGLVFAAEVEIRYITQPLDHSRNTGETYQQRVQVLVPDDTPKNSPVMFFLGGELTAPSTALQANQALYGAGRKMIFILADHRGYGSYSNEADQTIPTYVNAKDAVADFHSVIQQLRQEFTGPWIAIGYSYSGGLAVKLAAEHPEDADVVVSSSSVLSHPFVFDGHDQHIKKYWPEGMHEQMAKRIADLTPDPIFDQNWKDRNFLQWGLIGVSQYKVAQPLLQVFAKSSALTTPQFMAQFRAIDHASTNDMIANFAGAMGKRTLNLAEAQTTKFDGRYYIYQLCKELGIFESSTGADKIYPQTVEEYRDYCHEMFGFRPTFDRGANYHELLAKFPVPLISVVGELDPWASLGIQSSEIVPRGEYIFVPGGFHGPDRDDKAVAAKVMDSVFKYLPASSLKDCGGSL